MTALQKCQKVKTCWLPHGAWLGYSLGHECCPSVLADGTCVILKNQSTSPKDIFCHFRQLLPHSCSSVLFSNWVLISHLMLKDRGETLWLTAFCNLRLSWAAVLAGPCSLSFIHWSPLCTPWLQIMSSAQDSNHAPGIFWKWRPNAHLNLC